MKEQELLRSGIGRNLNFLGRAADMISISLSATAECPYEYAIHISTEGEIFLDGKLLTGTKDVYEYIRPDTTSYDEKIAEFRKLERVFLLQKISYDDQRCLHVQFSQGLEIHSLPTDPGDLSEMELWRIFFNWKAEDYLIATGNGVFMESREETQEELDRMRVIMQEARKKRAKKP